MSRLMQRLKSMESQADPKRRAERESHNLAGDGLEMAARVALESWQERPMHPDESDVFRLGYRLACHELALVFRAMRKGEPPNREEFEELRRLVFEDAAQQQPPGQFEDLNRYLPPAAEQVREAVARTKAMQADCTPAPDCAPAEDDTDSGT